MRPALISALFVLALVGTALAQQYEHPVYLPMTDGGGLTPMPTPTEDPGEVVVLSWRMVPDYTYIATYAVVGEVQNQTRVPVENVQLDITAIRI